MHDAYFAIPHYAITFFWITAYICQRNVFEIWTLYSKSNKFKAVYTYLQELFASVVFFQMTQ